MRINNDCQRKLVKEISEKHLKNGKPIRSAACYLSINDPLSAVIKLLRSNNIYYAYIISKLYNLKECMKVTAFKLARKATFL